MVRASSSVTLALDQSQSTTAGGEKNFSEAAGKALSKWLRKGGLKKGDEEDEKK